MRQACLVLSLLVFWIITPYATDASLGEGACRVKGYTEDGRFRLELRLTQSSQHFTIYAVKIYAEPSHTLLVAIDDPRLPDDLLQAIVAERPWSRVHGDISGLLEPDFVLRTPPATDNCIRIDYVILKGNEEIVDHTVRDVLIGRFDQFEFQSAARLDPESYDFWCYCGEAYCNHVTCPDAKTTYCCDMSPCRCYCGHVQCPK